MIRSCHTSHTLSGAVLHMYPEGRRAQRTLPNCQGHATCPYGQAHTPTAANPHTINPACKCQLSAQHTKNGSQRRKATAHAQSGAKLDLVACSHIQPHHTACVAMSSDDNKPTHPAGRGELHVSTRLHGTSAGGKVVKRLPPQPTSQQLAHMMQKAPKKRVQNRPGNATLG